MRAVNAVSRAPRYAEAMITMSYTAGRRKELGKALLRVLTPAEHTMVRELVHAERRGGPVPQPEEMLYWLRLNMPRASSRLEAVLHPRDC